MAVDVEVAESCGISRFGVQKVLRFLPSGSEEVNYSFSIHMLSWHKSWITRARARTQSETVDGIVQDFGRLTIGVFKSVICYIFLCRCLYRAIQDCQQENCKSNRYSIVPGVFGRV